MADLRKPDSKKTKPFSEDMIRECLAIIETGDIEDLFEIIPRIGVLRDARFNEPLLALLSDKNLKKREFAAYCMGAIGEMSFLEPLKKAFLEGMELRGAGAQELQVAIIEAIGSIGDDASVDFFLPALKTCCATMLAGVAGERKKESRIAERMSKWIIESLGAIAQQGGSRSLNALIELTTHNEPEVQAQALSELSVAYWHRPNEIRDSTLEQIYSLTTHPEPIVSESAIAALQNLADVGCHRAEEFFTSFEEENEEED